jgi:hypothetical protein
MQVFDREVGNPIVCRQEFLIVSNASGLCTYRKSNLIRPWTRSSFGQGPLQQSDPTLNTNRQYGGRACETDERKATNGNR